MMPGLRPCRSQQHFFALRDVLAYMAIAVKYWVGMMCTEGASCRCRDVPGPGAVCIARRVRSSPASPSPLHVLGRQSAGVSRTALRARPNSAPPAESRNGDPMASNVWLGKLLALGE